MLRVGVPAPGNGQKISAETDLCGGQMKRARSKGNEMVPFSTMIRHVHWNIRVMEWALSGSHFGLGTEKADPRSKAAFCGSRNEQGEGI